MYHRGLSTIYTSPVADIVRRHGRQYHINVDDAQVYIVFSPSIPGSVQEVIHWAIQCIREQQRWMMTNRLKMNEEHTDALLLCKNSEWALQHVSTIEIGNATVTFCEYARNLGVMFDQTFNMEVQMKSVCRSAYFQLRTTSRIRHMDPQRVAEQLTHASFTSINQLINQISIAPIFPV